MHQVFSLGAAAAVFAVYSAIKTHFFNFPDKNSYGFLLPIVLPLLLYPDHSGLLYGCQECMTK